MLATNVRAHGNRPFRVAMVHGGPGGAGELAELAADISDAYGVLEPLQTESSVDEQAAELALALRTYGNGPMTVAGHSWGAWLAIIVAARHPDLVQKLILVSSGVFDERFVIDMQATRLARLTPDERTELDQALAELQDQSATNETALATLARLTDKTDAFDPLPDNPETRPNTPNAANQGQIYASVWPQAAELRRSGGLLALAGQVSCPIVAIHGDSDPSPADGVRNPLEGTVRDFRFIPLARCGHTPWRERQAREAFLRTLREEIGP